MKKQEMVYLHCKVPKPLKEKLKDKAEMEDRTMTDQLIHTLKKSLK